MSARVPPAPGVGIQRPHPDQRLARHLRQCLRRRHPDPDARERPRPEAHGDRRQILQRQSLPRQQPIDLAHQPPRQRAPPLKDAHGPQRPRRLVRQRQDSRSRRWYPSQKSHAPDQGSPPVLDPVPVGRQSDLTALPPIRVRQRRSPIVPAAERRRSDPPIRSRRRRPRPNTRRRRVHTRPEESGRRYTSKWYSGQPPAGVFGDQGERGGVDRLVGRQAQPEREALGERGLARAEIADQAEHVAGTQQAAQAGGQGACLVGAVGLDGTCGVHAAKWSQPRASVGVRSRALGRDDAQARPCHLTDHGRWHPVASRRPVPRPRPPARRQAAARNPRRRTGRARRGPGPVAPPPAAGHR